MINSNKVAINEIFSSIQGEGLFIGEKQLFIRFCKCNLNCSYCDTDFSKPNAGEYSVEMLKNSVLLYPHQTITLTGGEPLLQTEFLSDFLNYNFDQKIYLETNGVLYSQLEKIIDKIDIIAMDVKLNSATGEANRFSENEKFLEIANKKQVFLKVIFDENIVDDEIERICNMAKGYDNTIVLQPKMPIFACLDIEEIFNRFYSKYQNIRLIPQVHKFLNLK